MDIIKRIQETATWIEKINKDYETNLYRTPELWPQKHIIYIPELQQIDVLEEVVAKRSKLLKESNNELLPFEDLHNYGRLMIFDVNSTVCDGAPQDVSNYYVDVNDTPLLIPGLLLEVSSPSMMYIKLRTIFSTSIF